MVASSDIPKHRKVGKAAVLPTAPAYTWGKARERRKDDPGPGPGEYDCSLSWSTSKAVGFKSSSRYKASADETPSPLDYNPSDAVRKSASSYTFRTKSTPEHLKSKTPGPGQYQPDPGYDAIKPGTPSFSLLARPRLKQDCNSTPAPNEYNAEFRAKEVRSATLKFRHSHSNVDPGPSPLDYADICFRRPASEGKSFGGSRPSSRLDNRNPGPGEYQPSVAPVRQRPHSWTMPRSARDKGDLREVPGPGTYFHAPVYDRDYGHGIRSDNRSAPAITVAGKPAPYGPEESPGPLDYGLPKDPRLKTSPAFTFHGTDEKNHSENSPGPGAYEWGSSHSAVRASAPQFSLGLKHEDPAMRERRPGPAEYTVPLKDTKPGVSLKFRHAGSGKDSGPSPLDYADKDFRKIYMSGYTRKGFTFGVKPKPKLQEQTPGPIYAVGCTTLGIAAATPLPQPKLDQIAVL